jgi:hypothetical protein
LVDNPLSLIVEWGSRERRPIASEDGNWRPERQWPMLQYVGNRCRD